MGRDTKTGKRTTKDVVGPLKSESGISDFDIESVRGSRGPDDYTPIQSFEGLSRKLGQIYEQTSQIPEIKAIANEAKDTVLVVKTEVSEMKPRIERAENKLMEAYDHSCLKEEVIAKLSQDTENLDAAKNENVKSITEINHRVKNVEEATNSFKKVRWHIVTTIVGSVSLIVAAIWYLSSLSTKVEMNERYFEEVKTELKSIRETAKQYDVSNQIKSLKAFMIKQQEDRE